MATSEQLPEEVGPTDDGLTDRQRRFIDAYMGDAKCVGVAAARMAGYSGDYNALCSTASTLLRNPKVRAGLNVRMENDPLIMGRTERLRELSRIARREITVTQAHPETGAAIEVPVVQIKDAIAAMKDLATAQGDHVVTKLEHSGPGGGPIETDNKVRVVSPATMARIRKEILGCDE